MHVAKLMNRETLNDPVPVTTPAEAEALRCHRGPGPSLENFRVHLNGRRLASAWNHAAAGLFAEDFIRTGWAEDVIPVKVKEMFMIHLITLRNQSRNQAEGGAELTQARRDKRKHENRVHRRRYVGAVVFVRFLHCLLSNCTTSCGIIEQTQAQPIPILPVFWLCGRRSHTRQ